MRRARFHGDGRVTLEKGVEPTPGPGELLLEVVAVGLCGSDRQAWRDGSAVTPGHETAGRVVGRGAGASTPDGSIGSVFLVAWCGECLRCRAGARGACLRKVAMLGFNRDGGFADRMVVPERCFLPLDPALSQETAVLLLDVTGTPLHALRRAGAMTSPPESAVVTGAGPLGLGCVLALGAIGVPRIVTVDVSMYRLQLAVRLGAEAIEGGADLVERLHATLPDGAALVLEASGNPTAQRQALEILAPGGQLVLLGHSPAALEISVSQGLIAVEKSVLGSEYFDPSEHAENQQLILTGRLDPSQALTHRFTLDQIQEAYETFWAGETGKVLVCP